MSKMFYYALCDQFDYIVEDEKEITNNYCGIYEKGIPLKYWSEKDKCKNFIKKGSNNRDNKYFNMKG